MNKQLKKLKRFKLLRPVANGGFVRTVIAAQKRNGHQNNESVLSELIVYSFLAYRAKSGAGASMREIVKETGLHRSTVKKAIVHLDQLCEQQGNKWFAQEPQRGWFITSDKLTGAHWHDRIVYTILYVSRKGATVPKPTGPRRFGMNHAAVFSLIISYAKHSNPTKRLSINYIASLLQGINRKTVAKVLDDLRTLGIIHCEQHGSRLAIQLLPLTDDHWQLFEPQVPPVDKPPAPSLELPELHGDEIKIDGYDEHRSVCERLMTEQLVEQAVKLAKRLGLQLEPFEDEVSAAKRLHDQNVKDGKCPFPNFGKYVVNRLNNQWQERERIRREERQRVKLEQHLASPEYAAAQRKQDEEAKADPCHPLHAPDADSVLERVRFSENPIKNRSEEYNLRMQLSRHIGAFVDGKKLGHQESIDASGELRSQIMKQALYRVNHHYGGDTRSTSDDFKAILNDALRAKGLEPVFRVDLDRSVSNKTKEEHACDPSGGARCLTVSSMGKKADDDAAVPMSEQLNNQDRQYLRELEAMGETQDHTTLDGSC